TSMSEFFDEIMASIDETREAARNKQLKTKVFVKPVKKYDAEGVKKLRRSLCMTQTMFAGLLGVSQKTVEAWESGRNIPMGPASRVLDLLSEDKTVADRFVSSTPLEEITVHG
ncbi:MAG: helix-turn-helix domain-containing protein, partial [Lachnospiraceae bacterium]|nr:helix-turn-helix domain-containing protein [Lachnospiraceae bacterium]